MAVATVTISGLGHDNVPVPHTLLQPIGTDPTHTVAPAVNTAADLQISGTTTSLTVCGAIFFSYNADPTGGNILITDGGNTILSLDIVSKGLYALYFNPPLRCTGTNQVLEIILAAGGAACTGKLFAHAWQENI